MLWRSRCTLLISAPLGYCDSRIRRVLDRLRRRDSEMPSTREGETTTSTGVGRASGECRSNVSSLSTESATSQPMSFVPGALVCSPFSAGAPAWSARAGDT